MHHSLKLVFFLPILALCFASCSDQKKADTLFEKMSPAESGIEFINRVENSEDFNIFVYRNFYNGGGVAIGDLNNDGLADVYLTSNMDKNKLFLNKGDFKFEDITDAAGVGGNRFWSTGVVTVDINADGLLDIYVCNAGYKTGEEPANELFINQGPDANGIPTFKEEAAAYGLDDTGYTTHAAFFDYDQDGDLDCYILNNSFMPVNTLKYSNQREMYAADWPVRDFLKGGGDKLLKNENGKFTDVSREAGIYGSLIGFGLGISVGDLNGDHWPDLYVSNDFYERDYLYINQKDGTFKEEIEQHMGHLSNASMGADLADINNDGYPDVFTTEMLPSDETRLKTNTQFENYNVYQLKQERGFYHQYMQNCLHLNNKDQTFSEIAYYSGVAASDWSWGALMFDMDNDGFRDIYVCNGIYKDLIDQDFIDFFADEVIQKMALTGQKEQVFEVLNQMPSNPLPNKVFQNSGQLHFEDAGEKWGLNEPSFSNGAAYGDLDNDGDLDLIVNNVNQEVMVYQNHSRDKNQNHFLALKLTGKNQNTYAIGSEVRVYAGEEEFAYQLNPSRGFQSSVDHKILFGLGQRSAVDSIRIVWPDQTQSLVYQPALDTLLQVSWQEAAASDIQAAAPHSIQTNVFFQQVDNNFDVHRENNFIDFYPEGLAFRMLSREGPKAAVADVNGDGLEDVYIGSASGLIGQLYVQKPGGAFAQSAQTAFEQDFRFEDTAVCFFDADGDGDSDLFVGSGGNEMPVNSRFMQNRLYLNDGKGHFTKNERALPLSGLNTAVAVPLDFDQDGDLDLFVGTRSIPGLYGAPPRHYLYENDGKGYFRDITNAAAPAFRNAGMLTDAVYADVLGDKTPELILVGEWGAPQIYEIKNRQLKLASTSLSEYRGWWSAIQAADLDGDGDQDLILGNRGENFYFQASDDQVAKLWVGDFDQNGTVDKIMTRSIHGKDMPMPLKKELISQLPSLKKITLKHAEYAQKSIQELFPEAVLNDAVVLDGNYFSSAVAINDGNGKFTVQALPPEVQFSSVSAIYCTDLNSDGKTDLVLAGNHSGFMPQYSKLDASFGHVLLNAGSGRFDRIPNKESGFFVRGDVKTLAGIQVNGKPYLLATANSLKPSLFLLHNKQVPQ